MQIKKLLKQNVVIVDDGGKSITKIVRTPFDRLTRRWCRHEANCLSDLTALGFPGAPALIRSSVDSITMEKVEGASLKRRHALDEPLFLRIVAVVRDLHRLGFAHGNLRLDNVLIPDAGDPVLVDFETCCPSSSPLFLLARFSDDARLCLLWHSRVVRGDRDLARRSFSRIVILAMLVIVPISRFAGVMKSAKKRLRRSWIFPSRQSPADSI